MKNNNFQTLENQLNESHQFPIVYMFKFIVPSDHDKIAQVSNMFGENAQITLRESSQGSFTSLTAKTVMTSAKEVIAKYKQATQIEGLIAL